VRHSQNVDILAEYDVDDTVREPFDFRGSNVRFE